MTLAAIYPVSKTVALGGAAVEVSGLSMRKLTRLILEYPDLLSLFGGGQIDIAKLVLEGPDMATAIFALSLVEYSDGARDLFENMPGGQQIAALGTIYDLTFTGGERAVPFLKNVVASLETTRKNSSAEPLQNGQEQSADEIAEAKISPEITPPSSSD